MHTLLFITVYMLASRPVTGWGDVGHQTVAYLAEKYFTDDGSRLVTDLLRNEKDYDISDAATFADTIKWKRPDTRPWHYIDVTDKPPRFCAVSYPTDCSSKGCIVTAMENMTQRVNDIDIEQVEQKEALMFLIHFFGDLHQPLHVEGICSGGNDIAVCFDNRCSKQNLHSVWDTAIPHKINRIKHSLKHNGEKEASAKWADRLYQANRLRPTSNECSSIQDPLGCIMQWAEESNWLNCNFVFKKGIQWLKDNDLGHEYYMEAAPIVEEQIFKAAIRLAVWVNALADSRASPDRYEYLVLQSDL